MTNLRQDTGPGISPKMPLWVKVSGIILIVLFLLVGIMLVSGVKHGPGLHNPSGANTTDQP